MSSLDPLTPFHPLVQAWFRDQVGVPTHAQHLAWPAIARGEHVLLTAPTGSGKTLAAFLWPLQLLLSGEWEPGRTRVVYVSPLKALNNDVQRNLLAPLAALKRIFAQAGEPWPAIRVLTRSGDTPGSERQRMVRHPPEILVTTPESLNLLVTSAGGRRMLEGVAMVILDEIHAVVGSKRGTHLITAVDRLCLLAGEVQRVALSATVHPLDAVARFVGGYELSGTAGAWSYTPRPVSVLRAEDARRVQLSVEIPDLEGDIPEDVEFSKIWWRSLVDAFKPALHDNRSTLIFANSRRITEKLTRFVNENEPEELAWSHHGSLSKEIRLVVEERLKAGELKAIVSTNSLELGIDVGALDEVILVQAPPTVASAVQRLGRAGHQVGGVSKGRMYPLPGLDLVWAAVLARAALAGDIEPVRPVMAPLDVLAQLILAMTGVQRWSLDELFAWVRSTAPYHALSRRQFDLVVDMLAGRYGDARVRALEPRLAVDALDGTAAARPGALRLVYLSGGTIPDRGYYALRTLDTKSRIGELDEEFVWERSLGDTFTLGAQTWRIQRITHSDVLVTPAGPDAAPSIIPFWRAEARSCSWHLAERLGTFLESANRGLDDPEFQDLLHRVHTLSRPAAAHLVQFLQRQRDATKADLPHRHHLLVEHFSDPVNRSGTKQVLLHTVWGGQVNHPLALALAAALRRQQAVEVQVFHNDVAVLVMLPEGFRAGDLLALVDGGNIDELLRDQLGRTGLFGAHFRENSARALLLPRNTGKKRLPLWLNRLRGKKLLEAIADRGDFPMVLESWRSILLDSFDLPGLARRLDEVRTGEIRVSECSTRSSSPFADGLVWRATNKYMYEDDTPEARQGVGVRPDLLAEVVHTAALRPEIPAAVAARLQGRLHRVAPGYAPRSAGELLEHVKERLLVPEAEWSALLQACERDAGEPVEIPADRLARVVPPGGQQGVVAVECLSLFPGAVITDLDGAPLDEALLARVPALELDLTAQWLSFYGVVPPALPGQALGELARLAPLVASAAVLSDVRVEGQVADHLCDADNLEILLRMTRAAARPGLQPLPVEQLPVFLAHHQGLTRPGASMDDLQRSLGQLFGYPARAAAWEQWLLPARLDPCPTHWLDSLAAETDVLWLGCGPQRVSFCFPEDLELFQEAEGMNPSAARGEADPSSPAVAEGFTPSALDDFLRERGSFGFDDALSATGLRSDDLARQLWEAVWAGRLTNDAFAVLRRGVQQRFEPATTLGKRPRRGARLGFDRWRATRPFQGTWRVLAPQDHAGEDAVDLMERDRDRVRVLLERYGVLFRQLLARELPALGWGRLFRALRLMELSGEVVGGLFFHGVPGPQFASHDALRTLRALPDDAVFWVNAADPASPCGLSLPDLPTPRRVPTTWLVYRGAQLAVVAHAGGERLDIALAHDHPDLPRCLALFKTWLGRSFEPVSKVEVAEINGEPATTGPYAAPLLAFGFVRDYRTLVLRRSY